MVVSRLEITHILRAIMREAALITVTLSADDFFLTSILAIDEDSNSVILERGRGRPRLSHALKSHPLSCSTTLYKVSIRFGGTGIEAADYGGSEAYRIALPAELLRIQRRDNYRVPTPLASPVKCRIAADESAGDPSVELNLYDISCGGIAVQSPPALFTPDLGTPCQCTVLLPGTPGLRTATQARNTFMLTLANGKITQRCGFAFVNPPPTMLATVQRYILNLERQRRTHGG